MENTQIIKTVNKAKLLEIYNKIKPILFNTNFILNINQKDLKNIILLLKHNDNLNAINISEYNFYFKNDEYINKNYYYDISKNKMIFKGYPKGNILLLIINNFYLCYINKSNIFEFYNFLAFIKSEINCLNILTDFIKNSLIIKDLDNIINDLKIYENPSRLILSLLGIRKTTGSIDNFIQIDNSILLNNFTEKNNPKSILTVGGKALCKHSHRSVTDKFWPPENGKDKDKNENALKMYEKFLKECIWINIHGLPHDIGTLELRIKEGYGIRWQFCIKYFEIEDKNLDFKISFRGFLEPQMEDGHAKGWIH